MHMLDGVVCLSTWMYVLVLNAPRAKEVWVYVVHVCAVMFMQDTGCVCTRRCMYHTAGRTRAKGRVCTLRVHVCT